MSLTAFFFVPAVIFLALVAPLWLLLHYWTQAKARKGLSDEERELLTNAVRVAERLEKRVMTLETILDAEHDGWRTADNRADDDQRPREH